MAKKDKTISFIERMEMDNLDPDWNIPCEFPDLTGYKEIAVDLETRDPETSPPLAPDGLGGTEILWALR